MLARSDEARPIWGDARIDESVLRPAIVRSAWFRGPAHAPASRGVNTLQAVRSVGRAAPSREPWPGLGGNAGLAAPRLAATRAAHRQFDRARHRWVIAAQPARDSASGDRPSSRLLRGAARIGRIWHATARGIVLCGVRSTARRARRVSFSHRFAAVRPMEFHGYRISHAASGTKCSREPHRATLAEFCPKSSNGSTSWLPSFSRLDREAPVELCRQRIAPRP